MVHLLVPTPKQKAFPPETLLALLLWRPRASSSSIPVIPNTPAAHELFGQARRFIVDYPGEQHCTHTANLSRGWRFPEVPVVYPYILLGGRQAKRQSCRVQCCASRSSRYAYSSMRRSADVQQKPSTLWTTLLVVHIVVEVLHYSRHTPQRVACII